MPLVHGTWSGYKVHGCRCPVCVEAGLGGNARRHADFKDFIALAKDKPCTDCGGRFPTVCMQFDHRDPAEKLFAISQASQRSRAAVVAEIAKCDLVCSNCHAVRTEVQMAAGLLRRGRPRKAV